MTAFLRIEQESDSGKRSGFANPALASRGLMEGRGEDELEAQTSGSISRRSSMGGGTSGGMGGAASPSPEQSLRRKMSGRRIRDFVRNLTSSTKDNDFAVDDDAASDEGPRIDTLEPRADEGETRRVLYLANVGDARAVLCRGGKAVRLTYDHKGSDSQEAKRITDAGGFVMNNRVNGGSWRLAVV